MNSPAVQLYQWAGHVDDKYQYSSDNKDCRVHGWISTKLHTGFWVITPSNEFKMGGPVKQDLTSHAGPISLSMFFSTHYAGVTSVISFGEGETWKKVFGPVFIYVNSVSRSEDPLKLWADAKEQMFIETQSWPYDFPASADFLPAEQRGGEIKIGHITFEPPRIGPTVWEIGIPDRTAAEFFVPDPNPGLMNQLYLDQADKFRQYGLWDSYTNLYPDHDLVYTVETCNYQTDWFFAQVNRKTGKTYKPTTWTIKFNLTNVVNDSSASYTLRIALASATDAELQVRINDASKAPFFSTGLIGKDNTVARHGIHGFYWLFTVNIPASMLFAGSTNAIYLTQSRAWIPWRNVMYDCLRLEAPYTNNTDMDKARSRLMLLGWLAIHCVSFFLVDSVADNVTGNSRKCSSSSVKLRISHDHVVMDNGIVKLELTKPSGLISGISYGGVNNVLEYKNKETQRGYWDIVWSRPEINQSNFDMLHSTSFKVISLTKEQLEVSFNITWNVSLGVSGLPLNIDKRFIMLRGVSGFYSYAIFEHKKGWPDLNIDEARIAFKLDKNIYVHGWISSNRHIGFWVITPSDEFRAGGPVKPDLTSHAGEETQIHELVYNPPRNGPTLWEIGIPDRTASEFYIPDPAPEFMNNLYIKHPEKFRQYGLWDRYTDLYPTDDLKYLVGVSDFRKDWFFAHVNRKADKKKYMPTTWQISFYVKNVVRNENYTLRLALASATLAEIQVRVNDPNKKQPHFTTGRIGKDNAIARHGNHGRHWLYSVNVMGSQLVNGNNTIYLKQARGGSPFTGVMYDYIRLEGPS
ncbi:rhamnogalacturonate lyase family protein, partial [Striga asiatica]